MQPLPEVTPVGPESQTTREPLPQVPWNKRDILWGVIGGFALLMAVTLLVTVGLRLYERVTDGTLLGTSAAITMLAELALLVPVWWFGLRKYHLTWDSVGLRGFSLGQGLGLGCLFLLFAFSFNMAWGLLLYFLDLRTQPDVLQLFGGGIQGLLMALVTGGIIVPIAEEIFFRGFVFAGLHQHLGLRRALLLNGILFALVHILPTSWPPIFVLGVLFALLYEQTGSIWPAVIAHGAINSFSFLALYWVEMMNF